MEKINVQNYTSDVCKKTGLFYGMFWNNDRGITKHTLGEVIESLNVRNYKSCKTGLRSFQTGHSSIIGT